MRLMIVLSAVFISCGVWATPQVYQLKCPAPKGPFSHASVTGSIVIYKTSQREIVNGVVEIVVKQKGPFKPESFDEALQFSGHVYYRPAHRSSGDPFRILRVEGKDSSASSEIYFFSLLLNKPEWELPAGRIRLKDGRFFRVGNCRLTPL